MKFILALSIVQAAIGGIMCFWGHSIGAWIVERIAKIVTQVINSWVVSLVLGLFAPLVLISIINGPNPAGVSRFIDSICGGIAVLWFFLIPLSVWHTVRILKGKFQRLEPKDCFAFITFFLMTVWAALEVFWIAALVSYPSSLGTNFRAVVLFAVFVGFLCGMFAVGNTRPFIIWFTAFVGARDVTGGLWGIAALISGRDLNGPIFILTMIALLIGLGTAGLSSQLGVSIGEKLSDFQSKLPFPKSKGSATRLAELEALKIQGLVSEAEYESKRKEILKDL
jgi:MFS family permease